MNFSFEYIMQIQSLVYSVTNVPLFKDFFKIQKGMR